MRRPDWQGKRTSDAWKKRFPAHPKSGISNLPYVEFCPPEWAIRENAGLRAPGLEILRGAPNPEFPPGDYDPAACYLIGFTDDVDAAVYVDLRWPSGPKIIYDNLHNGAVCVYATAFHSIDEFVQFYVEQHGP